MFAAPNGGMHGQLTIPQDAQILNGASGDCGWQIHVGIQFETI